MFLGIHYEYYTYDPVTTPLSWKTLTFVYEIPSDYCTYVFYAAGK